VHPSPKLAIRIWYYFYRRLSKNILQDTTIECFVKQEEIHTLISKDPDPVTKIADLQISRSEIAFD
jgi:hypothetical protein